MVRRPSWSLFVRLYNILGPNFSSCKTKLEQLRFIASSALAILTTSIQFIALTGFINPDLGIYFLGVFYLFIQTCIAFIRLVTEAILKSNNTN